MASHTVGRTKPNQTPPSLLKYISVDNPRCSLPASTDATLPGAASLAPRREPGFLRRGISMPNARQVPSPLVRPSWTAPSLHRGASGVSHCVTFAACGIRRMRCAVPARGAAERIRGARGIRGACTVAALLCCTRSPRAGADKKTAISLVCMEGDAVQQLEQTRLEVGAFPRFPCCGLPRREGPA